MIAADAKLLVAAVARWQSDSNLHPLTCGNDSQHPPLMAAQFLNGDVLLLCIADGCSYTQQLSPHLAQLLLNHGGHLVSQLCRCGHRYALHSGMSPHYCWECKCEGFESP